MIYFSHLEYKIIYYQAKIIFKYKIPHPCNQGFQFDFWPLASPHWLRTLRQNFARLVSLTAFQHVSKHATATLTQSCPDIKWEKVSTQV